MRLEDKSTCCVGVCACMYVWYGAAGGFHVPLPAARRLGQTSVTHTHKDTHTLHLSLLSTGVNTPSLTHTSVCITIHMRTFS